MDLRYKWKQLNKYQIQAEYRRDPIWNLIVKWNSKKKKDCFVMNIIENDL